MSTSVSTKHEYMTPITDGGGAATAAIVASALVGTWNTLLSGDDATVQIK
jgi:hypothetical protein